VGRPVSLTIHSGYPDFLDLPWDQPLSDWPIHSTRLVELPHGLSRHPVVFINYEGAVYALKELAQSDAKKEYENLIRIEALHLPVVIPVGFVQVNTETNDHSILITQYLDRSLPYRMLFMSQGLERYRTHLLDAMAGLLVQMHLVGVFWGDCSLSNTLFRRDAGALQAYMVDTETTEVNSDRLSPTLRFHDLEIMEENIDCELAELKFLGILATVKNQIPIANTGGYIRIKYQNLWEEITRPIIIGTGENYRIQERIRMLNDMGFSVGDVRITPTESGNELKFDVAVTDRSFHRDQLYGLTGLFVEEMQARKMMNEIQEQRALLSQSNGYETPLSVAAYHWLQITYKPISEQLNGLVNTHTTIAELYCQVLEHKWYLSERAGHDVGHQSATADYIEKIGQNILLDI